MANEFKVKNGLIVSGSADFEQDLRVRGTLTVDEFHTSITSSSIIYESGSTVFGNSLDDSHNMTGSLNVTGSINVIGTVNLNGQALGTGKLDETTFNSFTSSHNVSNSEFGTLTSSYNSFTSSYNTNSGSFNTRVSNLESFSSSLDVSFVNEIEFGTFSSSIKSFTSGLNIYTGSLENRIYGIEGTTGSLNTFTASVQSLINTTTSSLSSSIATTNLGQNNRLDLIEVKTGSYATTGSNTFKGTQLVSGSILPTDDNAYDLGSPSYQWRDVYISSGSLYVDGSKVLSSTAQELQITTDNGQSIKILEGTTDSIVLQTADGNIELKSSAAGDILLDPTNGKIVLKGTVELLNGNKIQSSVGGTPVVFANDIVVSGSIDITGTIEGIDLTAFSSSLNTRLGTLETSTGSLNSFTASAISRLNSLESTTSSLNSYTSSNNTRLGVIETSTSSLNTYTSSTNTRLSSIETTTSSLLSTNTTQNGRLDSLETTSGSILSTNTTQNSRLDSIEGKTGSYATTGSNIFQGTQTITGSLYISQDLVVAGSSSIQNISSSIVNIADNIITVNALNPSVRFGGLAVIDSGSSPQVSGSMLFDSVNNQWLFVHQNQGTITSSVLLMGPETYNNLGNEAYITTNRLVKSTGIEHLTDSNITDTGTKVSINSNTEITGSLISTANVTSNANLVSNYSVGDEGGEINLNKPVTNTTLTSGVTIDVWRDRVRIFESGGTNRGGYFDIASLSTGASTNLMGTAATASYVEYANVANKPALVSGSSQISFNSISDKPALVSGSSQITYGSISGIPSGIVSGSSQITFSGISGLPTLVSGSSQISFAGLSNVPGGLVSGSSQIDLTNTTNYASGIKTRLDAVGVISGSAQVSYGSITGVPSGIVSGSSQVSFGSISGVPSGLVSGSSQISFTGTTGYGSIINQAVLTSSSPTFAGLTSTSNINSNGILLGTDTTYGSPYRVVGFNSTADGGNRILAATGTTDGMYFMASTGNGFNFRPNGGTGNLVTISSGGTISSVGITSSAGISVSGGAYYTFNKPSPSGYQTVALFGSTANGIFLTSDSGIISRGAYFNNGWIATSTTGAYLNFNTSGGGMDLSVFSGATAGNAVSFTSLFTVARDNFSFNSNTILHAGNYNSYALPLTGGQLNGKITMSDSAYFTGAPSHGFRWNSSNDSFNNVIMRDNGNVEIRGSVIAGSVGSTPQATLQVVGTMRWSTGGNSYYSYSDMDGGGLYIETVDNNTSRAKIRFQTRVNNSGSYTSYQIDANGSQHIWVVGGSTRLTMNSGGDLLPGANGTQNVGSSSLRWNTVFTSDLSMSNGIGDYTIVEGEEDLFIYNNKNNKVFKFLLQEVDPSIVPPKKI